MSEASQQAAQKWTQMFRAENPRTGVVTLLLLMAKGDGTAELLCFGPKRHYRKAGGCRCVEELLASLTDEFRATVTVTPWGGKGEKLSTRAESTEASNDEEDVRL